MNVPGSRLCGYAVSYQGLAKETNVVRSFGADATSGQLYIRASSAMSFQLVELAAYSSGRAFGAAIKPASAMAGLIVHRIMGKVVFLKLS